MIHLMYIQVYNENFPLCICHHTVCCHSKVIEEAEARAIARKCMVGSTCCATGQAPVQGQFSCQERAPWNHTPTSQAPLNKPTNQVILKGIVSTYLLHTCSAAQCPDSRKNLFAFAPFHQFSHLWIYWRSPLYAQVLTASQKPILGPRPLKIKSNIKSIYH